MVATTSAVVQPRVELGAPERSTAAGNLSGDGHAVDIAYEPPAVDCLRAVWWSCTRVGQYATKMPSRNKS